MYKNDISLLVLALTVTMPNVSVAEDMNKNPKDRALLFDFDGLDLEGYHSGSFGMKYWLEDDLAIRGGFNISLYDTESDSTSSNPSSSNQDRYGIFVGAEHHFTMNSSISPYVGGEFGYSISDGSSKNEFGSSEIEVVTESDGYVLDFIIGLEYAVTKNVSLAAEYSVGYWVNKGETQYKTNGLETNKSDGEASSFETGSGALILMLYF